ncbi:MAG: phospho-N-acetylmuramoyl-pentapeptide-transferase [bacterium]|nr:phospho-N-acetylmuramoyl-pentapeptide-transferase [bacterium]
MLAELLYWIFPYQIFKSVFFRAGLTYLTCFLLVNAVMPRLIRTFRRQGITSDFTPYQESQGPYAGATPIMGGLVLVPALMLSFLAWGWLNRYSLAVLFITAAFTAIGAADDWGKVRQKRRILAGLAEKKDYADKADGISGSIRLGLELLATTLVILVLAYENGGMDTHLHIPGFPMKTWLPELSLWVFIPFVILVIVGGANAVNLTDGLDSLASVPIITSTVFVAAAAYVAGDAVWAERLKILFISPELKELVVFAIGLIAACFAFLKFNSPPASIYMGDVGSLGLGAAICTMFVLVGAELFLPIVGGSFVLAAVSVIIQRVWFKIALKKRGRQWAQKNRFFFRAPYHHHAQVLLTYREEDPEVRSIWHDWAIKLGWGHIPDEDKYLNREQVNNKVIWNNHLRAVFLLVIALMIFFKVR